MNREGVVPPDLGEVVEVETKPVKILDYENVVGQDSLTRLDEQNRRKKNKNRNKNHQQNKPGDHTQRPPVVTEGGQRPQAANHQNPGANNNPNQRKKFRPNRNNNNRPDQNRNGQQGKPE
jgi:hypothetical protein